MTSDSPISYSFDQFFKLFNSNTHGDYIILHENQTRTSGVMYNLHFDTMLLAKVLASIKLCNSVGENFIQINNIKSVDVKSGVFTSFTVKYLVGLKEKSIVIVSK